MYPRSKAKQYAKSYDKGVSEFYDPIVRSIPGMLSGIGMAFLGDPMNPTEAMAGEEDLLRQFREDQIRSVFPKPFRSTLKGDPSFEIVPADEIPERFSKKGKRLSPRIQDKYKGGLLGGQFLMMGDGPPRDISGQTFSSGYIDASNPQKPALRIAGLLEDFDPNETPKGSRQFVTNLFREFSPIYDKNEPWKMTGRGGPLRKYTDRPSALETFERGVTGDYLVSAEVKKGGDLYLPGYGNRGHVYGLETQFDSPVTMYQDMANVRAGNEPTLRPMTTGDIELGNQVGEFYTKGKAGKKLHPIFDKITFKQLKGLLK